MNKKRLIVIAVLVLLGGLFVVTTFFTGGKKKSDLPPGTHEVKVKEVIQTSNYTYLQVSEEDSADYWIAVTSRDAKAGDVFYFSKFMPMENFSSRELQRTFPVIHFVDNLSTTPSPATPAASSDQPRTPQKPQPKQWSDVSIVPPAGAINIAALFEHLKDYAGKTVTIRGVVVRFNPQIMDRNWVHIQDGSEHDGKFDLTVTTSDSLFVGSEATFKGTIALDKDFGAGYTYEVIMENAKVTDIKQ